MERPILFSGPMVRAILAGRKTMTRRVVKAQPEKGWDVGLYCTGAPEHGWTNYKRRGDGVWDQDGSRFQCPYGAPGDRLWVRETWQEQVDAYYYRATDELEYASVLQEWKPSIHMPRVASRITLEVTAVRVERLQEITSVDAESEGLESKTVNGCHYTVKFAFKELWERLNAKRGFGWDTNPWVWVIEFEVLEERGHVNVRVRE